MNHFDVAELTTIDARQLIAESDDAARNGDYLKALASLEQAVEMVVEATEIILRGLRSA